jgi:site-specific recombinase XerC
VDCNTLEELIDNYLDYLKLKGYSSSMLQTYEIPLRQLRDNCKWNQKDGEVTLDITLFKHLISKSGKRAFKKKISVLYLFIEYLKDELNLNIELKGDEEDLRASREKSPKEIIDSFLLQEQILIALFYGLNLKLKEISSLRVEDIDLELERLRVGDREYNLYPKLRDDLKSYLKDKKDGYIFERDGKSLSVSRLRNSIQKLSKRVNIPQKDFRDSFKNLYKIPSTNGSNLRQTI